MHWVFVCYLSKCALCDECWFILWWWLSNCALVLIDDICGMVWLMSLLNIHLIIINGVRIVHVYVIYDVNALIIDYIWCEAYPQWFLTAYLFVWMGRRSAGLVCAVSTWIAGAISVCWSLVRLWLGVVVLCWILYLWRFFFFLLHVEFLYWWIIWHVYVDL